MATDLDALLVAPPGPADRWSAWRGSRLFRWASADPPMCWAWGAWGRGWEHCRLLGPGPRRGHRRLDSKRADLGQSGTNGHCSPTPEICRWGSRRQTRACWCPAGALTPRTRARPPPTRRQGPLRSSALIDGAREAGISLRLEDRQTRT